MNKVFAKTLMTQANRQFCFKDYSRVYIGSPYAMIRVKGEDLPFDTAGADAKKQIKTVFNREQDRAEANLEIPSRDELASLLKGIRRDGGVFNLDLAEHEKNPADAPLLNAFYLLDILKLFGKKKPYAYHSGSPYDPVYLWQWDGDEIATDAVIFCRHRAGGVGGRK